MESQLASLRQELESEKSNHGETTGKLSSKDQEYTKLQQEHDARCVESEGHKSRIAELEAVSLLCRIPVLTVMTDANHICLVYRYT